jgi:hypothetical protein
MIKKILIIFSLILSGLFSNSIFAETKTGTFDLVGSFTGPTEFMSSGNSFIANYSGTLIFQDKQGTNSIFDKSSWYCVGSVMSSGEDGVEMALCKIALADSAEDEFIYFSGVNKNWPNPGAPGKFVGGTGKYENISGEVSMSYTGLPRLVKPEVAQSINLVNGSYAY